MNNLWTPELAERTAGVACAARGLSTPTDFVRFSEAAVFRSGDVAVRVDQGYTDRLTGDRARQMVDYMSSVGLQTIQTAGIETFVADNGLNVTFYRFMSEGDETQWDALLWGAGQQVRHIHDHALFDDIQKIAPDEMELDYTVRKTHSIVQRLHDFYADPDSSCFSSVQIKFLLERAEGFADLLVSHSTKTPHVVVHGDAHVGNAVLVHGQVHMYDFEEVGHAPAFVDHLHMLLADRLFNVPDTYDAFAAGYGEDLSQADGIDDWLEMTAYIYIVWAAGLGVVSEKHHFETQERFRLWETGLHNVGISNIQKDDMPYLWNLHM